MVNFVCFWLWQIPLAYVLAKVAGYGPDGLYLAIVIAQVTMAIAAFTLFRRGKWKRVSV
jgi:Na+-driven multidrug efflux pump